MGRLHRWVQCKHKDPLKGGEGAGRSNREGQLLNPGRKMRNQGTKQLPDAEKGKEQSPLENLEGTSSALA